MAGVVGWMVDYKVAEAGGWNIKDGSMLAATLKT